MSTMSHDASEDVAAGNYSALSGLEAVHNCRDVGRTINRYLGRKVLKEGVLYRSGRLDTATAADLDILGNTTKLQSVIDLRSDTERARLRRQNPDAKPINVIFSTTIHNISFPSSEFYRRALFGKLSWYRLIQFIVYYLLQLKTAAIRILVTQVIIPTGLKRGACEELRYSSTQVRSVFDVLSDAKSYPILVHCTQGKDRTGLIILLILLCVLGNDDADIRAIDYDYMLTNEGLTKVKKEIMDDIRPYGFTEESGFGNAQEGWVEFVADFIDEEFGGVEKYLANIGVGGDALKVLRDCLLVDPN